VLTGKRADMAKELYSNKQNAIADICKTLGISQATLYRLH